jgi:hypothetical protein
MEYKRHDASLIDQYKLTDNSTFRNTSSWRAHRGGTMDEFGKDGVPEYGKGGLRSPPRSPCGPSAAPSGFGSPGGRSGFDRATGGSSPRREWGSPGGSPHQRGKGMARSAVGPWDKERTSGPADGPGGWSGMPPPLNINSGGTSPGGSSLERLERTRSNSAGGSADMKWRRGVTAPPTIPPAGLVPGDS